MMKVKSLIVLLSMIFSLQAMANEPVKIGEPQSAEPKYGQDSVACVQNLSLYRESYKQWKQSKYKSPAVYHAMTNWHWVFANCPRSTENLYIDGAKMIDFFIKTTNDDQRKQTAVPALIRLEWLPGFPG